MSKIGRKKIIIPEGVKVEVIDHTVKVSSPKGEQNFDLQKNISVEVFENSVSVNRKKDDKQSKSLHGLTRQLIDNMVIGLSKGFIKQLDFKGVGFKAEVSGGVLTLNVGFSHPVIFKVPEGIEIKVEKNVITVSGSDKQKVGQAAAEIRAIKPVEPYKGKGIKYINEIPRRKAGKAAKAAIGSNQ
ncbi:MAG: 50S ribosomal protein L6 [Patescibacteria group bacterium]|jgi:large subunit ribosomal protein L6